jgi:methylated-DNA-[protein]-cysteine S-methyltransferase
VSLRQLRMETPLGALRLVADDDGICAASFRAQRHHDGLGDGAVDVSDHPILDRFAAELRAYFDGTLKRFETPFSPRGTEFQQDVWRALRDIPFGATCSYAEIARAVGRKDAVRAVGHANGHNPSPSPCRATG